MNRFETAESVERLLNLVPLLYANPGIRLKELLPLTRYRKPSELQKALEQLLMFGVPPFSPADLIELFVEEDGRVYLELPQGLDRPVELLPEEWNAVREVLERAIGFQEPNQASADVLRRILEKLSAVPVAYESESTVARKRALVERALGEDLQLEFVYRTLSAKQGEVRRVDPWAVFAHRGASYLVAYCHMRRDARSFHLERVENLELLDLRRETQAPEELPELLQSSPILRRDEHGLLVKLKFRAELRAALDYQFGLAGVETAEPPPGRQGGWLSGECRTPSPMWFRTTLRAFGPGVRIESPAHLREEMLADLETIVPPGSLSRPGPLDPAGPTRP